MYKLVLITLALSGLQALPISRHLTKTYHALPPGVQDSHPVPLPDSFIVDHNTGLVQDYINEMDKNAEIEDAPVLKNGGGWVRVDVEDTIPDGFRQGTEPSRRIPEGFRQGTEPFMPIRDGFRQGTEPSVKVPRGFRQGTEPANPDAYRTKALLKALPAINDDTIPDGFRQGTEPSRRIPEGFRQGTEPFMPIRDGFRQGTEPSVKVPRGFRQGTEPANPDAYRTKALLKGIPALNVDTVPDGFRQGTEPSRRIPEGFRQGTEPFMPIRDGFRQGTEPSVKVPRGFRQGTEPANPDAYRTKALLKGIPALNVDTVPDGFRQGTEPSRRIPEGFRQGTEPFMPIRDGFRQGTEPSVKVPRGFRQGTEPANPDAYRTKALLKALPAINVDTIPDGFRQGTEPSRRIPEGFRQGTEPFMPIRDGFRQGTEPSVKVPRGFRQGTEPANPDAYRTDALLKALPVENVNAIPDNFKASNEILSGFRPGNGPFMPVRDGEAQGIEPSNHIPASVWHENELAIMNKPKTPQCEGEIINGRCYAFNPTRLPFLEAQDSCKRLSPNAELASVTSEDLHSRLVSLVTSGGEKEPVMTWLGGMVKNQRGSWLDGAEWGYSDWMPGQPNIQTDKPVCVEMFRLDETWWSAADCDLKRASLCSYPVVA